MLLFMAMTCPEDEKSFAGELYQKYKRFLYARAYEILRNREDAEDAVETAVLGVLRHIERFRGAPETDVLCQLSIYIRNASIGILRKNRRQAAREQSYSEETVRESVRVLPDTSPLPEEQLLDREAAERAEAVVAELPSPVRDAVMLVCFYRYSVADAAQVLGVTPNAVSLRLYKARKQILEKLEGLS